jgi:hypothetical protein
VIFGLRPIDQRPSGSPRFRDDQHQCAVWCSYRNINVRFGVDHLGRSARAPDSSMKSVRCSRRGRRIPTTQSAHRGLVAAHPAKPVGLKGSRQNRHSVQGECHSVDDGTRLRSRPISFTRIPIFGSDRERTDAIRSFVLGGIEEDVHQSKCHLLSLYRCSGALPGRVSGWTGSVHVVEPGFRSCGRDVRSVGAGSTRTKYPTAPRQERGRSRFRTTGAASSTARAGR